MKRITYYLTLFYAIGLLEGCSKEFLSIKPDKKLAVPENVDDLAALLNNRIFYSSASIVLSTGSTDEFYVKDGQLDGITSRTAINTYLFSKDIFENENSIDWEKGYERILYSNLILSVIDTLRTYESNLNIISDIKGQALFHRASSYYQLVQIFCSEYNETSGKESPCLPIRLDYDLTIKPRQGSVIDLYELIIKDLKASAELLSEFNNIYKPSKEAAYLLLARAYLHLGDYNNSLHYSNLAINIKSNLIDFSELDSTLEYTFPSNLDLNIEIIFNHEAPSALTPLNSLSRQNVSEELLNLYESGDLRKAMFYRTHTTGNIIFKGCYRPFSTIWGGLSTNELYLIRSEANIRLGNVKEALEDLNYLRKHRFKKEEFQEFNSNNTQEILKFIVEERRRELPFRGVRWEDMKRFNKEFIFARDHIRFYNGNQYILKIGSSKWVFPFPDLEMEIHHWKQLPRD